MISCVSSCPILTVAAIRHLAKALAKIHSTKGGIASSSYINVGSNVIHAIAKTKLYITISSSGYLLLNNRRFSSTDASDHEILRHL
ncbi:unnamed protein product [Rotaria sp. Silwood2]|nr:unnamed protein product [Rotaria sp. Silwood2]